MATTQISFRRSASAAAATLALFVLGAAIPPAKAESVPSGSYLTSCTAVRMDGRTLRAVCRAANGQQVANELHEVDNCRNDIVNENGRLVCKLGTQPPRGRAEQSAPSYGQNPPYGGGGGAYPYGQAPRGYGQGGGSGPGERCEQLRGRYRELRDRLNYTSEPYERERLERRLGEARGEYRSSCGDPRD